MLDELINNNYKFTNNMLNKIKTMDDVFDFFRVLLAYDAERDFYAKYFPSILEDESITRFRPMKKWDIPNVLTIEERVYEFPWNKRTFLDCMRIGYHCLVLERAGTILAYGILCPGFEESHIMNICVAPKFHGRGYGRKMMERLIEIAHEDGSEKMLLEVRPSNLSALRLYENMGFKQVGVRKGYYPAREGREDAILCTLELVEQTEGKGDESGDKLNQ